MMTVAQRAENRVRITAAHNQYVVDRDAAKYARAVTYRMMLMYMGVI